MDRFLLVFAICFAVLFYRLAYLERMTGWVWAIASFGLSMLTLQIAAGLLPMLVVQVTLFGLLWWKTLMRRAQTTARQVEEREQRDRQREELLRRGREEYERERLRQDAPPAPESPGGTNDVRPGERTGA